MSAEPISLAMFRVLSSWWEERGDGVPPDDVLPAIGRVVVDAVGSPLVAAYLYTPPGCRVAILDWLVTCPGLSANRSRLACLELLSALESIARDSGCAVMFASVTRAGMAIEAQRAGFTVAAENCIHLVKRLN